MIRLIRKFGTFKRPPPGYMFKRPVVPSDLEAPSKNKFDIENDKWCDNDEKKDNWGKNLYNGKYGNSLYEPHHTLERQKSDTNPYNDRQD